MIRKPYVFFYGGYMDEALLRRLGADPQDGEPALLAGFALTIGPLANLVEQEDAHAYGLLSRLSHSDLERLYGSNSGALKGGIYLPEAVTVHTTGGRPVPALTYICPALSGEKPDAAYIENLALTASGLGAPSGYIDHIRRFARV